MTPIGWVVVATAALFVIALFRTLVVLGAKFPLDPEINTPPPPTVDPVQPQWPQQANIETRVSLSRRSRRAWSQSARDLLRPLVTGRTMNSFASVPVELDAPRRYNDEWMEQALLNAEHDLGLSPPDASR